MSESQVHRDRLTRFWELIGLKSSASMACETIGAKRCQGHLWAKAAGGRVPVPKPPPAGGYLRQDDRFRAADVRMNQCRCQEDLSSAQTGTIDYFSRLARNRHPL